MSRVDVSIKRLDPAVSLPEYAYSGDAGLDLRCNESVDLAPFERRLVSTGLAIALPDGYAGFVQPRSGLLLSAGCLSSILLVSLMLTTAVNSRSFLSTLMQKNLFTLKRASESLSL